MKREFDRVTYSVPSRSFFIESYISKDDRLPIVTEIAIRIIRVVREMPILALRTYLGLSEQEMAVLLDELDRQKLVSVCDDLVTLTSYAVTHFEASSDDLPRFTTIEKRDDRVDFELLTFCPVNGRDAPKFSGRTFVLEPQDAEALAHSNRRAEAAYQDQFDRILRMKGVNNRQRMDVYKVTSVEADRNFYIPVSISFELDEQGEYSRNEPDLGSEAPTESVGKLDALISDTLQAPAQSGVRDLAFHFVDRFEDKVLSQYNARSGFQWAKYLAEVFESNLSLYSGDTHPIFGNFYINRNKALLVREIRAALAESSQGAHSTNAFWMAPDIRLWGRTQDAKSTFDAVGRALDNTVSLHSILPASNAHSGGIQSTTLSSRTLYYIPPPLWKGRLEMLLVPPYLAACIIHLPLSEAPGVSVPVGFVTRDPRRVEIARQTLVECVRGASLFAVPQPKGKPSRMQLGDETYSCLDYVPIIHVDSGFQPLMTRSPT